MTTHIARPDFGHGTGTVSHEHDELQIVALLGRILFSAIFIMTVLTHFSEGTIGYAASHGVPFAGLAVPLSGVIATLGGLSILFGYHARLGAWLIVVFLVPVTLFMHPFWAVHEPMMHQLQLASFMKNVSMLGGALLLAYFGAGPLSIDARVHH
jgi:putative oxidoreductase